jgi:hypothetical protein
VNALAIANRKEMFAERNRMMVQRVGIYSGERGTPAAEYITQIERECQTSELDGTQPKIADQRPYILSKTLMQGSVAEWFFNPPVTTQTSLTQLRKEFLKMFLPATFQQELKTRWRKRTQLPDETVRAAYANKLKYLVDLMNTGFKPTRFEQTLHFRLGLRDQIKSKMKPRLANFDKLEEVIKEAIKYNQDYVNNLQSLQPDEEVYSSLTAGLEEDEPMHPSIQAVYKQSSVHKALRSKRANHNAHDDMDMTEEALSTFNNLTIKKP